MRPLLVFVVLAVATAGFTASGSGAATLRTAGATRVDLLNGVGKATLWRQGTLSARVGHGRIVVTDLAGGYPPKVSCDRRGYRASMTTRVYEGWGVSCLVSGGPWKVVLRGSNIDAGGVVRGYLVLSGSSGLFKYADRPWRRWPLEPRTYKLGWG